MAEIRVRGERSITASPEQVYTYIADYIHHHPRFLPSNFSEFRVEEGGIGAGTVISFRMKAGGRDRTSRAHIAEPEPGRVLTEHIEGTSLVTTFTVSPESGGSHVVIDTRWQSAKGIGGFMERAFAPRVLRRIYADELSRLDAYARQQGSAQ